MADEKRTGWEVSKPFPMDGTHNFRDLGGYPAGNKRTRQGSFFRSDGLHRLSEEDRKWMKEQGITCVLDLRSRRETENSPDALTEEFEYYKIPMSDRMTEENDSQFPDRLSELYIQILEVHQKEFRQIMKILADRKGKPAVFHCAVGKDRTGVTAMLLLSLAGVPEEVILQDYAASGENMRAVFEEQKKLLKQAGWEVPDLLFESPREEMEQTIRYMKEKWGDVSSYLESCGVTEEEMEALRNYLVA